MKRAPLKSGNTLYSTTDSQGFSLVEMMVATLIGALLIVTALSFMLQSRAAWQSAENVAALEERAAYALTELEQDARMAGYWGQHADGALINIPEHISVHCNTGDVSTWALRLERPVEAGNGAYTLPCPPYSGTVSASDTLSFRHSAPVESEAESSRVQLSANHVGGELIQGDADLPPDHPIYNLAVHAWYLDRRSSETGLPALRRYALVNDGLMQNQEVIPGIENFQVSLGVDRDADGVIDGFVNPGNEGDTASVMAVRLWILVRSALPEPGHIDNGPWRSIDSNSSLPLRPGDSFRRVAAERTIWLRNQPGS